MPHLYLPTDHTDADLVLAADVAAAVSSADLYVSWTIESGAGAPEIEAVVREERPAPRRRTRSPTSSSPSSRASRTLWRSLTGPPAQRIEPAPRHGRPRDGRAAALARRSGLGRAVGGAVLRRPALASLLALGRLGALARPRLVELDAPLAVLGLHQRQARRGTSGPSGP